MNFIYATKKSVTTIKHNQQQKWQTIKIYKSNEKNTSRFISHFKFRLNGCQNKTTS